MNTGQNLCLCLYPCEEIADVVQMDEPADWERVERLLLQRQG